MGKDIIYREDAIEALKGRENILHDAYTAVAIIRSIPSTDRPQGEWRDMGDFEKCSVCKATHLKKFQSYYGKVTWIKTPYCPHCGAKMKGTDDGEDIQSEAE